MSLENIKPIYLEWVKKTEKKTPEEMLNELVPEIETLNSNILNGNLSNNEIQEGIIDLRNKLLYSKLLYSNIQLKDPDKDWGEIDKRFNIMTRSMDNIDLYETNNILKENKKNLDIISWITVIILPLSLITSYYGMNFSSMGSPSTNTNPYAFKYGQLWIFFLFGISLTITIILLKVFYK